MPWEWCGGGGNAASPAPGGVPRRLQPKIESAHGQETLSACSRGGGISSEWKENASSPPETISAPPPRSGDLQGCPREPGGTVFPHQGVRRGGAEAAHGWEKLKKGCENLLREPGLGRAQAGGSGKGSGDGVKERREGERRKVRDGGKETAVIGVRHGAGDRDRSLAHRGCPRCHMGHPAPSQVKTAGPEGS